MAAPGTETAEQWMVLLQTYGGWGTTVALALWYGVRERGRSVERKEAAEERDRILLACKTERETAAAAAKAERDEVVTRNAARFRELEDDRDEILARYEALAEKAAEERATTQAKLDAISKRLDDIQ